MGRTPRQTNRKAERMKTSFTLALALATVSFAAPMAAFAMPVLGDIVGTNPADATAALEAAGCTVTEFEAEDGKIEAKCTDVATSKAMEVYIDPKTGAVVDIKSED
jgi:Peptidase propeptide and YPEB domain